MRKIYLVTDNRLSDPKEAFYAVEVILGLLNIQVEAQPALREAARYKDKLIMVYSRPDFQFLEFLRSSGIKFIWLYSSDFFYADYLRDNLVTSMYEDLKAGIVSFWRLNVKVAGDYIAHKSGYMEIGHDIIASAFVLLTMYEEFVQHSDDAHGRFDRQGSLSERFGLTYRAVVHEYADLIKLCIKKIYDINLDAHNKKTAKIVLGLDIDFKDARSVVSNEDIIGLIKGLRIKRLASLLRKDPSDLEHLYKYFIRERIRPSIFILVTFNPAHDKAYEINRDLLSKWQRGFEVGLHGSYDSMAITGSIYKEAEYLRGLLQDRIYGARQHYLRWRPQMWDVYEEAGLLYDSSVAARHGIGLRNGMMSPYRVFSIRQKRKLNLVEFPIIYSDQLLKNLRTREELKKCLDSWERVVDIANSYGGLITLMWHNTTFNEFLNPSGAGMFNRLFRGRDKRFDFYTFKEALGRTVN